MYMYSSFINLSSLGCWYLLKYWPYSRGWCNG